MRGERRRAALRAALAVLLVAIRGGAGTLAGAVPPLRRGAGTAFRRLRSAAAVLHAGVRRRPDAALVAILLTGVLLMVLHWRGTAAARAPAEREAPPAHVTAAGP